MLICLALLHEVCHFGVKRLGLRAHRSLQRLLHVSQLPGQVSLQVAQRCRVTFCCGVHRGFEVFRHPGAGIGHDLLHLLGGEPGSFEVGDCLVHGVKPGGVTFLRVSNRFGQVGLGCGYVGRHLCNVPTQCGNLLVEVGFDCLQYRRIDTGLTCKVFDLFDERVVPCRVKVLFCLVCQIGLGVLPHQLLDVFLCGLLEPQRSVGSFDFILVYYARVGVCRSFRAQLFRSFFPGELLSFLGCCGIPGGLQRLNHFLWRLNLVLDLLRGVLHRVNNYRFFWSRCIRFWGYRQWGLWLWQFVQQLLHVRWGYPDNFLRLCIDSCAAPVRISNECKPVTPTVQLCARVSTLVVDCDWHDATKQPRRNPGAIPKYSVSTLSRWFGGLA